MTNFFLRHLVAFLSPPQSQNKKASEKIQLEWDIPAEATQSTRGVAIRIPNGRAVNIRGVHFFQLA